MIGLSRDKTKGNKLLLLNNMLITITTTKTMATICFFMPGKQQINELK